MAVLVPAILTKDKHDLREKIEFLEGIPEIRDVQIDFEDGKFVPNKTVLPDEIENLQTRLAVEAHLMVANPQQYFVDLEKLAASLVVLHHESFISDEKLINCIHNARSVGFKVAVAINPETEVAVFDNLVETLDVAMIMSVHPGFQGRGFLPETFERIKILQKKYPDVIIEIDGGVKLANIAQVAACGVERIVVGSGIWQTPDAQKTITKMIKLMNK